MHQSQANDADDTTTSKPIITKDTGIAMGLVLTLAGACVSFGVMYQRINGLEDQIEALKTSINSVSSVRDDTILMREQLRQFNIVMQEVREDVKTLKARD